MKFVGAFLLLFCTVVVLAGTSITDTIIPIEAVVSKGVRFNHYGTGTMVYVIDSSVLEQTTSLSLGELLSTNSLAQVKTYGPGNISSLSIRGGSNTHTLLVWNGFGLRSSNHGGCNYSSLPVSAIDHVTVQHGGSSTMYGSGAATGIIFISKKLSPDNSGFSALVGSRLGSFETAAHQTQLQYAGKKMATSVQVAFQKSANNYTYINTERAGDPVETLEHAAYRQFSVTQQNAYRPNKHQLLETDIWYTQTFSEAPSLMSNRASGTTHQVDHDFRSAINYSYYFRWGSVKARAGAFTERNMYVDTDPKAAVQSGNNQSVRFNIESEVRYDIHPQHKLYAGLGYQHEYGLSEAYANDPERQRISFFGRYQASLFQNYLGYAIEARQDFDGASPAPFVYSLGVEQNIWGGLALKGTLKKHYSLPTMNQLYWKPDAFAQGNDSLLAESGWDYQLGLVHRFEQQNLSVKNELTTFLLDIENWIVWLPVGDNGKYIPVNQDKVESKGIEFIGNIAWTKSNYKLSVNYLYAFTDATSFEFREGDTLTYPKVYTPKHKAVLGVTGSCKGFSVAYSQTYVSQRFIDGAGNFLDGYFLADISLSQKIQIDRYSIKIQTGVGNVFNTSYQLTNGYPMPPRNYQIGIQFKL